MDLDDELRELFASDRMDVPVRPDAEHLIVTGARRLRRRRITAVAAAGAAVLIVAAGVVLAGGQPDAMPPAIRNPTTTPLTLETTTSVDESTEEAPPAGTIGTGTTKNTPKTELTETSPAGPPDLGFEEIGPTGLRGLLLGQTLVEAQATGMLGNETRESIGSCAVYELLVDGQRAGQVFMSDTVQAIAADQVQTTGGVGASWTIEQVKTVYPDLDEQSALANGRALVPVPGNDDARYRLGFRDDVVTGVTLQAANQVCYE